MHKFFTFVEKLIAPLSTKWKYALAFVLFGVITFAPILDVVFKTMAVHVVVGIMQLTFAFFCGTIYGIASWETREAHHAHLFAELTAMRSDIEDKLQELREARGNH